MDEMDAWQEELERFPLLLTVPVLRHLIAIAIVM